LRWTLDHRGWSVAGILAISMVSVVPMMNTKGGGDDSNPGQINIFYQWKGAYSKEEMGREVARVEEFVNANRERFHIEKVYSRYNKQDMTCTRLSLTIKVRELNQQIQEQRREGLPQSARAKLGIGSTRGMGNDGQGIRISLVGDSY